MISKTKRLTSALFDEVIGQGKIFHFPILSLKAIKVKNCPSDNGQRSRFAVVAAKKYFKTAVTRNKFRRKTYQALTPIRIQLDTITQKFPDKIFHCIILLKPNVMKLDQEQLTEEIQKIFIASRIISNNQVE